MSALSLITAEFSNREQVLGLAHQSTGSSQQAAGTLKPFGEDGFSFADVVDIFNPLQHIPVLNTIYRKITGDQIDPAARIAGGALFGGPIGAALAVAGAALEKMDNDPVPAIEVDPLKTPTVTPVIIAAAPGSSAIPESNGAAAIQSKTGETVQIRGGWIVNAAYQGKSSALFEWARNPASEYGGHLQVSTAAGEDSSGVSVNI